MVDVVMEGHGGLERIVSKDEMNKLMKDGSSSTNKGYFPRSGFNGASGEWARKQHLTAGGCAKTTGFNFSPL